MVVMTAKY